MTVPYMKYQYYNTKAQITEIILSSYVEIYYLEKRGEGYKSIFPSLRILDDLKMQTLILYVKIC